MVRRVEPPGRLRVHPGQLLQQRPDSLLLQLALEGMADRPAGAAGGEGPPGEDGLQVEACAAGQYGEFIS